MLWVVLAAVLFLLICAAVAWMFPSRILGFFASKSADSPAASQCEEISGITLEKLTYASSIPAKRDIPETKGNFSYQERVSASSLSFKLPFSGHPEISATSTVTGIKFGDAHLLVVAGNNIAQWKELANTTTCPGLKSELNAWFAGKTDLQIAHELLYVTPAEQGTMSHDLLYTLLGFKELMHVGKDAQEMTVNGWTIFQFGTPSAGSGRVDIYSKEGIEVSDFVFSKMSQEQLDYIFSSISEAATH